MLLEELEDPLGLGRMVACQRDGDRGEAGVGSGRIGPCGLLDERQEAVEFDPCRRFQEVFIQPTLGRGNCFERLDAFEDQRAGLLDLAKLQPALGDLSQHVDPTFGVGRTFVES